MAQKKIKIGHIACLTPGCDTMIPVRENVETKALSFPCHECGMPSYAKCDGSKHYKDTLARIKPLATSQDVPEPPSQAAKLVNIFG